jgi:hypothetical protein
LLLLLLLLLKLFFPDDGELANAVGTELMGDADLRFDED